jgi:LPS export ABC transporter protein LptC
MRPNLPMITLALLLVTCTRPPEQEAPPEPPPVGPRPEVEQWDALIRLYETGQLQARLKAGYLAQYAPPTGAYTRMDTVTSDFFDSAGEETSHLVARAGIIYDQEREGRRRVKTWGDVVLTGSEGQTVRADTLWWDEDRDRVWTLGPVEVTDQGDVLRGTGFESDTALTDIRVYQGSGTFPRGGRWLEQERETGQAGGDTTATRPDTLRSARGDSVVRIPPRGIP